MSFEQDHEDLVMTEKGMFQKICRVFLKQTFIVGDRNEESRKMYFFIRKHGELFSDYFRYMGFDVVVDQDNKVAMLQNRSNEGIQSNRLRFRKYESIVLCCLWTMYADQIREGNLSRPILVTIFDLRQTMEKYGVKEELEGKSLLRDALELFSRYQLINVNGEIGNPECEIRLFASLQFALDVQEFRKFVDAADERMRGAVRDGGLDEEDADGEEVGDDEEDENAS